MRKMSVSAVLFSVALIISTAFVTPNAAHAKDRIKLVNSVSDDIVILQPYDRIAVDALPVKTITIGGNNNSPECSYFEIIEKAKQLAIANGANIIKINQHDQSNGSVCDKLKATLYKSAELATCEKEFSWRKDRKLIWNDFRGRIPSHATERTAATISCEIGFETNTISGTGDDLYIHVYNKFSKGESWSRLEDQNDEVLIHEQGHFDLCELYTRKLRERLSNITVSLNTMKPTLQKIYNQVLAEYRDAQDRYEAETHHGVNMPQQQRWTRFLDQQLNQTEYWMEAYALDNQ